MQTSTARPCALLPGGGFTLIEVMITVAIVAILSAIALPNYRQYIQRSNRVEARNTMMTVAQRLEQNYTLNSAYNVSSTSGGTATIADATLATWGFDQVPAGGEARYNITFSSGAPSTTTFTILATPVGSQASDTCGILSLDSRNLKSAAGQGNRSSKTRECWGH
jgi:type IV pilus assembly protein PilE